MNIMTVGTAAGYAKNMAMNIKFRQRAEEPAKHNDDDIMISQIKEQAEQARKSNKLSSLHCKMLSGMSLTQDELDYLSENAPEEYEKAIKIKNEREEYKKELEQCRSKEDVEKLKQRKLSQFSSEAKTISGNPCITSGEKRELLEFLTMRMNSVINEHARFTETPEYQTLPEKNNNGGPAGTNTFYTDRLTVEMDLKLKSIAKNKDYFRGYSAETETSAPAPPASADTAASAPAPDEASMPVLSVPAAKLSLKA